MTIMMRVPRIARSVVLDGWSHRLPQTNSFFTSSPTKPTPAHQFPRHRPSEPTLEIPSIQVPVGFYFRHLTLADSTSCVALEIDAFTEHLDRVTREKYDFRLANYPSLSLGLFRTTPAFMPTPQVHPLAPAFGAIAVPPGPASLVGICCSTPCVGSLTLDSDMCVPPSGQPIPLGETIAFHSLCIVAELQGKGLGSMLLRAYLAKLRTDFRARLVKANEETGRKMSIICHDHLVHYYERFGWVLRGKSPAQFGAGGWWDMVLDLKEDDKHVKKRLAEVKANVVEEIPSRESEVQQINFTHWLL